MLDMVDMVDTQRYSVRGKTVLQCSWSAGCKVEVVLLLFLSDFGSHRNWKVSDDGQTSLPH